MRRFRMIVVIRRAVAEVIPSVLLYPTGAVYTCHVFPTSRLYTVSATDDSVANVTVTSWTYQPFRPSGSAGETWAVVSGGSAEI